MNMISSFQQALKNISAYKLRACLAILGVLVGTASVVSLVSAGTLATEHALKQFSQLGTHLLTLNLRTRGIQTHSGGRNGLSLSELSSLSQKTPGVSMMAPYTTFYGYLQFQNNATHTEVLGVNESLDTLAHIGIQAGRFISALDQSAFFCVLGDSIARRLSPLGASRLVGKQISINGWYFTVAGIAKPWHPSLFLYANINDGVLIPIKTSILMLKGAKIQSVIVGVNNVKKIDLIKKRLLSELNNTHPNDKVTFQDPKKILNIMLKQKNTFSLLLIAIASISLVVGGIGVMNIMLVSVSERRQEIGIRSAIGARPCDILLMFLSEAVLITGVGGVLGILFGVLIAYVASAFFSWSFHFYLYPAALGLSVSIISGLVSGLYPAWRASRTDPILALKTQ